MMNVTRRVEREKEDRVVAFFFLSSRVDNGKLTLVTGMRRVFAMTCAHMCVRVCLRWDVHRKRISVRETYGKRWIPFTRVE